MLCHSPLSCVPRLAAAGILVDAIHTDGTIEALVVGTLINVHLTALPLEALRTGTAVLLRRVGTNATIDTLLIVADGAANGCVLLLLLMKTECDTFFLHCKLIYIERNKPQT